MRLMMKLSLPKPAYFFGLKVNSLTQKETIDLIIDSVYQKQILSHCVINVAKLVNAQKNDSLRKSVNTCDIVNADGMGVVWGARLMGLNIPERVTGMDLMLALFDRLEGSDLSVYFLGATDEVLKQAIARIREQYPKLKISGAHHGYFKGDDISVVRDIQSKQPDFVFVAMTSPFKEHFIATYQKTLGVPFMMGVGGSLDIISGKVSRAPLWMQNSGLEWLYRLCREPRRMWRRYLVTNVKFLWMIFCARSSKCKQREA